MTTLALILGMLPVAIGLGSGSDFRQPMALVIIGGLITSTILTLVIVPTAYSLVEGGMERLKKSRAEREARPVRSKETAEPVPAE
jgi:HAE1 family hydrophobic/amphiphilic exporter-1